MKDIGLEQKSLGSTETFLCQLPRPIRWRSLSSNIFGAGIRASPERIVLASLCFCLLLGR
jgi:hypothetical protein